MVSPGSLERVLFSSVSSVATTLVMVMGGSYLDMGPLAGTGSVASSVAAAVVSAAVVAASVAAAVVAAAVVAAAAAVVAAGVVPPQLVRSIRADTNRQRTVSVLFFINASSLQIRVGYQEKYIDCVHVAQW
jgi:hypothetical protein